MSRLLKPSILAALLLLGPPVFGQVDDFPFSQLLDRFEQPIWYAQLGVVDDAQVSFGEDGGTSFSMVEANAGSGLVYLQTSLGTLDLRTALDSWFFTSGGGVDLPDQVGALRLDVSWVLRSPDGTALELGTWPGFYTDFRDLSGQDFFMPLNIAIHRSFSPELAGKAGLNIFPSFERVVDPEVGVRWAVGEWALVDLFYPESRVAISPSPAWSLYTGLRALLYPEFQLREGDQRNRFRYREWRWSIGSDFALSGSVKLMVEGGSSFDRHISFEDVTGKADVEDALFFRIGLGGLL